jgi:hypothetical protein
VTWSVQPQTRWTAVRFSAARFAQGRAAGGDPVGATGMMFVAVREGDAGGGERDLHDVFGEVAGRGSRPVGRRDIAGRR